MTTEEQLAAINAGWTKSEAEREVFERAWRQHVGKKGSYKERWQNEAFVNHKIKQAAFHTAKVALAAQTALEALAPKARPAHVDTEEKLVARRAKYEAMKKAACAPG